MPNFKSAAAYKKWLAYGHASGEFAKTPGHQSVSIKGKKKKVKHQTGGDIESYPFGGFTPRPFTPMPFMSPMFGNFKPQARTRYNINYEPGAMQFVYANGGYLPVTRMPKKSRNIYQDGGPTDSLEVSSFERLMNSKVGKDYGLDDTLRVRLIEELSKPVPVDRNTGKYVKDSKGNSFYVERSTSGDYWVERNDGSRYLYGVSEDEGFLDGASIEFWEDNNNKGHLSLKRGSNQIIRDRSTFDTDRIDTLNIAPPVIRKHGGEVPHFVYDHGGYLPEYGLGKWLKTGSWKGDKKSSKIGRGLWKVADLFTETLGNTAKIALDPLNIGYGKKIRRGLGRAVGEDRHQKGLDQISDTIGGIGEGGLKGFSKFIPGGSGLYKGVEKMYDYGDRTFGNVGQEYYGQDQFEGYGKGTGQLAAAVLGTMYTGNVAGGISAGLGGAQDLFKTGNIDKYGRSKGKQGLQTLSNVAGAGSDIAGMFTGGAGAYDWMGKAAKWAPTMGAVGTGTNILASRNPRQQAYQAPAPAPSYQPPSYNMPQYNVTYGANPWGYANGGYLPEYGFGSWLKKVNPFKREEKLPTGIGVPFPDDPNAPPDTPGVNTPGAKKVEQNINYYNPYANEKYGYSGMVPSTMTAGSSLGGYMADMSIMPHGGLYKHGGDVHPMAEYEVEQGELIYHPEDMPRVLEHGGLTQLAEDFSRVDGNKHSDAGGGPQMAGGKGGYVLSDDPKMQVPDELYNQLKNLV